MMWKRVATGAALIPIVVAIVLWTATAWVALLVALVILLALFEYFSLGDAIGHRGYRFWTAACALLMIYLRWAETREPTYQLSGALTLRHEVLPLGLESNNVPAVFFLFVLGVAVLTLLTKRPLVEALPAAGISSSGLLLVAFPLTFAVRLHGVERIGPRLLLFVLVIVWVGDTIAYFVGRTVGKHLLTPHLSPNKTWEGTITSLGGSLLAGVLMARWLDLPMPHLLGMAGVGNIAGQMGDLLESAYKRSAGVKDSGALLPGHGGMLDRVDALILAIPVVWYYWALVHSPGR
jgi:phosphatidate cytidylyltransferase